MNLHASNVISHNNYVPHSNTAVKRLPVHEQSTYLFKTLEKGSSRKTWTSEAERRFFDRLFEVFFTECLKLLRCSFTSRKDCF